MSRLGWGESGGGGVIGADARVWGNVKAGYTGLYKGGTGEGRATLTALVVLFLFFFL